LGERLNREIRRRTDVVGVFPDPQRGDPPDRRGPGQQHDEWAEGRRYLGLDVLGRARLTLIDNTDHNQEATPAINAISA
jgi:putative transposase